jgi:acetyl-CoA acetyltransferase
MSGAHAYDGVALVAPVTVAYQRHSDRKASYFVGVALRAMLAAAGIAKTQVDGLAVSSFTLAPDTVVSLTEHFDLPVRWIEQIPLGGAAGIVAMRRAARAIQCGDADIVACIGADTNPKGAFGAMVSRFSEFSADAAYPYGAAGPNGVFALIADAYMTRFGATRDAFGRLCVAQRENARSFPHALLRAPLTIADYLAARPIAEPFHLFDCVMPCAGAEGFLVMSVDRARALALPHAVILAAGELHHAFASDPVQYRGGWALYRDRLYETAALGPDDIDMVQTYDDYPVMSVIQLEDLGFAAKGEGWRFILDHDLTCAGDFPHNTSGGQLSCGQAGAAGGYLGLVEAIRQVTGKALGAQVPDAGTAMVSGYGMVNYDRGLCSSAAIIARRGP